ncbi:MAG: glycosyltransferase [Rhodobacter sp.]|nr:glycosyltransferase [Rhodobacter sp.]
MAEAKAREKSPRRVCILMGVYNGAVDLPEQLQSFAEQTHAAWDLIASDDGSTDASRDILRRFAEDRAAHGNSVTLIDGPRQGFAMNFLSLIARAPGEAGWLACSDQDDVWLPDRLARGIAALSALPAGTPALYCSRTWITDERLENRRLSADFIRPPSFRNALVQNIAAGNTLLLNRAAAGLAQTAAPEAQTSPGLAAHDWWLYQLITGAGGTVVRDPEPTLLYRQHTRNLIGANDGWRARMGRIGMLLGGRFSDWNAANIAALRASAARLTAENRTALTGFADLRTGALPARLWRFARSGLYRQTALGQAALWLAVALRRI